jgi:hypothetical protein
MAKRSRRQRPRLALPWERENSPFRALFSGRRFLPLVVLLSCLGLLTGAYWFGGRQSDIRATRATLAEISRATESFVHDIGRCPRALSELAHPPRSGVNYLSEVPTDAWGNNLYFHCAGAETPEIEVLSAGPSGSFLDDDNVM